MKSKKTPKAQRFTGVPVIFMEGGIVQDVFIPNEREKDGFTAIQYDIVDVDELKEGDDETIVARWEALETATRLYYLKHAVETQHYFRDAMERVRTKKITMHERFNKTRRIRNLTDICWGEVVLRRDLKDGDIQDISLTKALDELTLDLDPKRYPNHSAIVRELANGKVLQGGKSKFEYALDQKD